MIKPIAALSALILVTGCAHEPTFWNKDMCTRYRVWDQYSYYDPKVKEVVAECDARGIGTNKRLYRFHARLYPQPNAHHPNSRRPVYPAGSLVPFYPTNLRPSRQNYGRY